MGTGCGSSSGNNALYYAVTIPAFTRVDVQTTPTADIVLLTQDACGAAACAARQNIENVGYHGAYHFYLPHLFYHDFFYCV